jgi:isopenicillin-N N-acyltransferase-like protein
MGGDLDIENIEDFCRDHFNYPYSICRHPPLGVHESEAGVTAVSLISDLDSEEMYIACGPPCEYEYERVPLKLS